MKTCVRFIRVVTAIALLGASIAGASGCSLLGASPAEAMESSNRAMAKITSVAFSAEFEVETGGQTFPVTMEGVGRMPSDSKVTMTTTIEGQTLTIETVTVDGTVYSRYPEASDTWGYAKLGLQATTPGQATNPTSYLGYLQSFAEVEDLGREEIEGVECDHYAVDVDESKITDVMLEQFEASGVAFEDPSIADALREVYENSTIDVEVWVGRDDMLVRKELIEMTVKGDMPMVMRGTMTFGDYNAPVEIEVPTGAIPLEELTATLADEALVNACFANQRMLEGAAQMYAADNVDLPASLDALVPTYLNERPVCPDAGTYDYDATNGQVRCSVHGRYAD